MKTMLNRHMLPSRTFRIYITNATNQMIQINHKKRINYLQYLRLLNNVNKIVKHL
jgi:hypothetical protein